MPPAVPRKVCAYYCRRVCWWPQGDHGQVASYHDAILHPLYIIVSGAKKGHFGMGLYSLKFQFYLQLYSFRNFGMGLYSLGVGHLAIQPYSLQNFGIQLYSLKFQFYPKLHSLIFRFYLKLYSLGKVYPFDRIVPVHPLQSQNHRKSPKSPTFLPLSTCLRLRILSSVVYLLFFIVFGVGFPRRLTHHLAQIS